MTTIAKLRIEVRTTTRLMLRRIEMTTRTTLPTVAKVIRRARGWYADGAFRFASNGKIWSSTRRRRDGTKLPARNRRLEDVIEGSQEFVFTHDGAGRRTLTVEVEGVTESPESETAFPKLTDCAGVLALDDLTLDDSTYWIIGERYDQTSTRREFALELCSNEGKRAEYTEAWASVDINQIRLRRRGPIRSHQSSSKRRGDAGLAPEPETAKSASRRKPEDDYPPVQLGGVKPLTPPVYRMEEGRAYLIDPTESDQLRSDAWGAMENLEADSIMEPGNDRWLKEAGRIAKSAPGDLIVTALYAEALERWHRWREARDVYRHTLDLGLRALPDNFRAPVSEMTDQGTGFLKAVAGLARLDAEHGNRDDAIELLEKLLEWNEKDDNEATLRLGSEYVYRGRLDDARPLIERKRSTRRGRVSKSRTTNSGAGERTGAGNPRRSPPDRGTP